MTNRIRIITTICAITVCMTLIRCGSSSKSGDNNDAASNKTEINTTPLNLSVFVDLSDRISKRKDNMLQADKDQSIINGLVDMFINRQKKNGFQKSEDSFQIVFYPAPTGSDSLARKLSLDLGNIQGPKNRPLLDFQKTHANDLKTLYNKSLEEQNFFGSDIWGFFSKDKVADLCKKDVRNVLVIISDGYLYDANNLIQEGKNYSYILPKTLAVKGSGLIPCKISNPNMEIIFIECNANPQTDYRKMESILRNWFIDMGIENVDIQDTDLPTNTLKHLEKQIFANQ